MPIIEVKVPDIGDFKDVTVIEILVQTGEQIQKDQSLMTVESDKASMEVPSDAAGLVKEVLVKLGDKVNQGSAILLLEVSQAQSSDDTQFGSDPQAGAAPESPASEKAEKTQPEPKAAQPAAQAALQAEPVHAPLSVALDKLPHASPSIRKMARELGVPLSEIKGSGAKGRITEEDLRHFVRDVMSGSIRTQAQAQKQGTGSGGAGLDLLAWPAVDFEKFGAIERKPLSRIQKIAGANLHRNWVVIPHVTNHEDADITELEAFRVQLNKEAEKTKSNVKYTLLAFLIKASVAALKQHPVFNTSLQGDELVYKKYYNIGFAADTPQGLVVPVVKNADQKGVADIATEVAALARKAREGKISPADMSGGCFTISSLGGFGGTYFTPIVNAPEVAILGVCRGAMKPVWDGKTFVPRLMLPMSLSYDHRVIDGAVAAKFNAYLASVLADFRRVLL